LIAQQWLEVASRHDAVLWAKVLGKLFNFFPSSAKALGMVPILTVGMVAGKHKANLGFLAVAIELHCFGLQNSELFALGLVGN
jgi:hypothetical protein